MRSFTTLDLQYAHRFYGFKGEAQYLHGHTGVLTIEVEDTVNTGVNMVFPCNEIQKTAWDVLQNFDHALVLREDDPLSLIQRNGLKAIDSKETHQQIVDIMEGGYEAFKRRNVIYSTWKKKLKFSDRHGVL